MPVTITNLLWPDYRAADLGPFERNADDVLLAVGVRNVTNDYVGVFRSSNGGSTWVVELDTASRPQLSTQTNGSTVQALQVDTTYLDVLYVDSGDLIQIQPFDMVTGGGQWASKASGMTTSAPVIDPVSQPHVSGGNAVHFVRRGSDSWAVACQDVETMDKGSFFRKWDIWTFESGAWTRRTPSGQTSNVHYDIRAVALLGTDTYFFYTRSDGLNSIYYRVLSSGNSLGAESSFSLGAGVPGGQNYSVGLPAIWNDGGGNDILIPAAAGAGTPPFGVGKVPANTYTSNNATNPAEYTNAPPGVCVTDGTDLYLIWPDDSTQDLWLDKLVSGSFGTDEEIQDAATVQGVCAHYLSNQSALAYLYDDGGTVKYDEYSLGPGGASLLVPPRQLHPRGNILLRR